jgi:hypothetical protein
MNLTIEQTAELDRMRSKAETGEQWAAVCKREAEMLLENGEPMTVRLESGERTIVTVDVFPPIGAVAASPRPLQVAAVFRARPDELTMVTSRRFTPEEPLVHLADADGYIHIPIELISDDASPRVAALYRRIVNSPDRPAAARAWRRLRAALGRRPARQQSLAREPAAGMPARRYAGLPASGSSRAEAGSSSPETGPNRTPPEGRR